MMLFRCQVTRLVKESDPGRLLIVTSAKRDRIAFGGSMRLVDQSRLRVQSPHSVVKDA